MGQRWQPAGVDSIRSPRLNTCTNRYLTVLFKKKTNPKTIRRHVTISRSAMDSIISYCKIKHPNEAILILKGRAKNGQIDIDGLVIPPFSYSDTSSAGFDMWSLPTDSSYVGTVHSHPGGSAEPSLPDLLNYYGLISLIIKWPYADTDIYAWDSKGAQVDLTISKI